MKKNIYGLLLCAGVGSRLGKITSNKPKCLVNINGINCLDFWIMKFKKFGIKNILINTHYKSSQIKYHIKKNWNLENINFKITFEKKLLGTAGTINKNYKYFSQSENILIVHCDMITDFNLEDFNVYHQKNKKNFLATMSSFNTNNYKNCGMIFEKNNKVYKYIEKPQYYVNTKLANASIYLLSKDYLKFIKKNFSKAEDFARDIIPHTFKLFKLYKHHGYLIDIGTVKNLNKAKDLV